jgi:multiple sugar transport system permease protein
MVHRVNRAFPLLALLLGTSVLGYADDGTNPPRVVRFTYWANYLENQYVVKVCEAFERANPGITIKREWCVGDYGRKLQLLFITGKAGDILMMDDEYFPTYGVRGYLEDLRPYILRESDDIERGLAAELRYIETPENEREPGAPREYLPTALQSFNYRGFQGGLPWDGNICLMFYNKDLFDQERVPYPSKDWTWEEFRGLAKRFTKDLNGDGYIDQFGTNMGFDMLGLEPIVWSYGGDLLNADRSRCTIQEPPGMAACQLIYDMKMTDRSIAWTGELSGFYTEVQLLTGRVAIVPSMSYMIPALNRVQDAMRWGLAHMPLGPYGQRYTRATWDGISIYRHTTPEKKEVAWRFLKQFLSDESQALVGDMQRGIPVRRSIAWKHFVQPDTPAEEEIALEAMDYARLTPITPRYQELRDAFNTDLERLSFADVSHVTPQEILPGLEPKVNKVLEKELAEWTARTSTAAPVGVQLSVRAASAMAVGIVLALFAASMLFRPARRSFLRQVDEVRHMLRSKRARIEGLEGILFASPWLIGLCLFTAFPILFSIILSFSEWDPYEPIEKLRFIGLGNFLRAFSSDEVTGDPLMRKALYNSLFYAVFAVPLGLSASLGLALLLNQPIRGITIFRTTFYLPSIISGVATVVLWMYILNPAFGPLNAFIRAANNFLDWTGVLAFIDLPEPKWLEDPHWAKPSLILMSLWGAGGAGMLIFLAGLQGVPDQLYEVAELDGAGRARKFWNITLPMLTPTIYFNLIMGIIGALKVFMQAFILTNGTGGTEKSLLFYVLHLYTKAFVEYEMGYASALAWILFVIILALTLLVIRSSAAWVYYEGEVKR